MKSEFDLTKMVEEITMQAKETQEEFIFETIQPYCENVLQMKINKEELKQILLNGVKFPGWIPVSERLPEKAGVYVVSMNRLGYPQREVDGFVGGKWERFGNDVIAWMPLPEPYKESEDKE